MQAMKRTRIAPSPTGNLHIGSLAIALRNYAVAKQAEGQFIIRIEDTDRERLVPGAQENLLQTLKDFGLTWDEGPVVGGDYGPYVQSERLEIYHEHVQQLIDNDKAYYCFCDKKRLEDLRQQQQLAKQLPAYDRHCLSLSKQEIEEKLKTETPYVVRLKVPKDQTISFTDLLRGSIKFESNGLDDQVLLKSDGFPTYHLAVVVDDHLMKITHVIRGEEWISSTPKHVLLYQAFGWPQPIYAHMPVFLNPSGKGKMSKRFGDTEAGSYLTKGYLPEAVLNFLMIMGWAPKDKDEVVSLERFVREFRLEDVSSKSVVFDTGKLDWLNGLYIRKMTNDELLSCLEKFKPDQLSREQLTRVLPLIKERLVTLADLPALTDFIYAYTPATPELLLKKADSGLVTNQLDKSVGLLNSKADWTPENMYQAFADLAQEHNWHKGQFFMLLRLSVTGKTATPPLFETMLMLGLKECKERISKTTKSLSISPHVW